MRLEAKNTQRLEQRLLPQMLQSIEVLQLATVDLLALVAQELQSNEVLELLAGEEEIAAAMAAATAAATATADWVAPGVRRTSDEVDGKRALLENQPAAVDSLVEFVRLQVAFRQLPQALAGSVVLLAEHLDDRGLLPLPLAEVAAATGVDPQLLEPALAVLRTLEPAGIGAGSAVEAMLLQAAGDPDFATIERLLTGHLEALARNQLPDVARAVQMNVDDLSALLARMRALEPAPAGAFRAAAEPAIRPDAHAWLADGQVQVALADGAVPALAVDATYESLLAAAGTERTVRDYLRPKVRAAKELIGAISLRQATLLRVVAAAMQRQREFFVRGRAALRPLAMRDVAVELGMHASTVSRAIAGKYVGTVLGTFRLRDFFDGGGDGGPAAPGLARGAIAQRIADLVAAEDRAEPLPDDGLVAALAAMGIDVARRTVTKFRQELGIPSSYRRRRHGGWGGWE